MPKLKKEYDVAIAYSQVSSLKYYLIDKITAKKKYAFYHNGAYTFDDHTKQLDKKYYSQYDAVCAVSPGAMKLLSDTFGDEVQVKLVPNSIQETEILRQAEIPCLEIESYGGFKMVTVSRLSPEKNPLLLVDVCAELSKKTEDYRLFVIGDGELKSAMEARIHDKNLEKNVQMVGYRENPYCFMKNCDLYIQMSEYEAEPLTIKEMALFGKPMVLSNIEGFRLYKDALPTITLVEKNPKEIVDAILNIWNNKTTTHATQTLNQFAFDAIDELFN